MAKAQDLLRVFHGVKSVESERYFQFLKMGFQVGGLSFKVNENYFYFETCQRFVCVSCAHEVDLVRVRDWYLLKMNWLCGEEAYCFLLKWACGLESVVLGETDIFGQIKKTWLQIQEDPSSSRKLFKWMNSWMQHLFQDTKEIRADWLQSLGGSSYGTLVRKWMKSTVPCLFSKEEARKSVLCVGAGQIAQEVGMLLLEDAEMHAWRLQFWNRHQERLALFCTTLQKRARNAPLVCIETTLQEEIAWKESQCVVLCIPLDEKQDVERVRKFQQGCSGRFLLHLGARKTDRCVWEELPGYFCLDDLFLFQEKLGKQRVVQVQRALRACDQRARLRSLGDSLVTPHGWEDLACFG